MSRLKMIELSDSLKSEGYYVTMYIEDGKLIMKMQNKNNNKSSDIEITTEDIESDNFTVKNKLKNKVK